MRSVRRVRLAVHEQPFPDADIAADIEWKRHVVVARLAGHRRKRLQVGKEVADVLDRRMLVGRIWKGREIMLAVRRRPLEHRRDEIRFAPPADTVSRIGRDVGNVKRPERRRHRKPAAQLQPIGLVGNGVAGGTAAGIERCDAVGEVRRVSEQAKPGQRPPGSSATRRCRRRRRQPGSSQGEFVAAFTDPSSERFRAKWVPVRMKKTRQNENPSFGPD